MIEIKVVIKHENGNESDSTFSAYGNAIAFLEGLKSEANEKDEDATAADADKAADADAGEKDTAADASADAAGSSTTGADTAASADADKAA